MVESVIGPTGLSWEKPQLGLVEYDGSTANNLLHPRSHFAIRNLFIDPMGPPEGRYFVDGIADPEMTFERFAQIRQAMQYEGLSDAEVAQKVELEQPVRLHFTLRQRRLYFFQIVP